MYKQTLCVTLPISAAVIIAAALFAKAGDLDPDPGPIQPTMRTLQEIYDLVQQSSPCGGCTWEYKHLSSVAPLEVLAIEGSGVLHGMWLKGATASSFQGTLEISDGPFNGGISIGEFGSREVTGNTTGQLSNKFFELNVVFEQGLYTRSTSQSPEVTFLYRSTDP